MKTTTSITQAAAVAAEAQRRFAVAETAVLEKRATLELAARVAGISKGLDLADALASRDAARRELDAVESAFARAGDQWQRALKEHAAAKAAHRAERCPQVRAETRKIAREIDSYFAALEKLFDQQAEPLASEVERDLCITHSPGISTNCPELGTAPVLGVLRMCGRREELRDLITLWRSAAALVK